MESKEFKVETVCYEIGSKDLTAAYISIILWPFRGREKKRIFSVKKKRKEEFKER